MMKHILRAFFLTSVLLSASCSDSLSPTKEPDFSQLQFYADISQGWGFGYELRVYRSGWALIRNWPPVEGEWADATEISLKSSEMKVMNEMERNFDGYRHSYPLARIDADEYMIVLATSTPDTTHFCCPYVDEAEVPGSLQRGAGAFNAIAERGLE